KTEPGGILPQSNVYISTSTPANTDGSISIATGAASTLPNISGVTSSTSDAKAAHHRRHSSSDTSPAPSVTSSSALALPLAVHTPLQLNNRAQKEPHTEMLVEDFGSDGNCVDIWGRTQLHLVAYLGDINLLELFLSRCHPSLI